MRPQQNRRMRGRNNNNNNNRRGPNPLSRNYESNGPDVKIRGNAQHIADKYTTLARDAQASGDRVIAENYLQHAEHYIRIILAAQAQMPQPIQRNDDEEEAENNEVENFDEVTNNTDSQEDLANSPQPIIDGTPAEVAFKENNNMDEPKKRSSRAKTQNNTEETQKQKPHRTRRSSPKNEEATQAENQTENTDETQDDVVEVSAAVKKPRRRVVKIDAAE